MSKQSKRKEQAALCTLCVLPSREHPTLLNTALYNKYTAMTEYRSYKQLNGIVAGQHSPMYELLKDLLTLDDTKECLKRYHVTAVGKTKQSGLLKYYKYHVSLPQCNITAVDKIIQRWQNLQLRLYYKHIKRELNMEVSRTEETTKKSANSSVTCNHPSCSCLLCGLESVHQSDGSMPLDDPKRLMKSESKALQELLKVLNNNTRLEDQSYLKEDFMKVSDDSTGKEQFEKFMNSHSTNALKRHSNEIQQRNSPARKEGLFKKRISELKSVSQMVQQNQKKPTSRPKLLFTKKASGVSDWSPIYNFINNFLKDDAVQQSPFHKKSSSKTIRTLQSQFRSTKGLKQHQRLPLRSYQTVMPTILPRGSVHKSKQKPRSQESKEPFNDPLIQNPSNLRQKSLSSHRGSGSSAGQKVKTQIRISKRKRLSLERVKTIAPAPSIDLKAFVQTPEKRESKLNLLITSPLSEQFRSVGKLIPRKHH